MRNRISKCPCCNEMLQITVLKCPECGMELSNKFEQSNFDRLSNDKYEFLMTFLKQRGNLKNVQNDLGISYPTAKKKLEELLTALELVNEEEITESEDIDMSNLIVDHNSTKASEIIKAKLMQQGGRATVFTARGLPCEIWADADGTTFSCNKLPIKPNYEYKVFDVVTELLLAGGGSARKGNGRNYKLGEPECDEKTIVGVVAKNYAGKKNGESVFDPVFVLAAVLEWADIAYNGRGELILTENYLNILRDTAREIPDIEKLSHRFTEELKEKAFLAKKECNYNPVRYLQMLAQNGGVETAKQLIESGIRTGHTSSGFATLLLCGRLDLTMENSVCKPEYAWLFTEQEISYCKELLSTT